MPAPQPGPWVGEEGGFWQLWMWLGEPALSGEGRAGWEACTLHFRAKRDIEGCGAAGELAPEQTPRHKGRLVLLVTAAVGQQEDGRDGLQGNSSCTEMLKLLGRKKG